MLSVLVLQHVPHERLGTFEDAFRAAGLTPLPVNTYDPKARWVEPSEAQGIVVMGGPMSVYQQEQHPVLRKELALLEAAIKANVPVLGVCLGAQLLAHALGAPVTKAGQAEIGWYPVSREPGADGDRLLSAFGQTETVFQWHSDTYGLPRNAVRLASSPRCREQAFRYGTYQYGLQFHLEVTEAMIRAWMQQPENTRQLSTVRQVSEALTIRRESPAYLPRLTTLSRNVAGRFAELIRQVAAE
jgi:GMP synthase (glutamine-hydrolysing)